MVIKWNTCPGGHINLFFSTQACGLDIGPHIAKPGSNIAWWRFVNTVLNCGIQRGGQRLWSLSAEHLGNSEKPFIWLLSHIFLRCCSWYCFIFCVIHPSRTSHAFYVFEIKFVYDFLTKLKYVYQMKKVSLPEICLSRSSLLELSKPACCLPRALPRW